MYNLLKTSKKLQITLIITLTIISIVISTVSIFSNADNFTHSSSNNNEYSTIKRDTSISVNSNGVLQINRTNNNNINSINNMEDSWTILLYMTGTNLESQYGNATSEFREILQSNFNTSNVKNLNFIIQTGGCEKWHSQNISNNKIQRYCINNTSKELQLIEELDNSSMGSVDTLYNFLEWGTKTYPAKHTGVIFWDHGTGVSNGLCADPLYNNDSITVHELEYTFAKLSNKISSKFELIGFDTCLAGSIEYANLLAPYGNYMVASSDLEPGSGWFYTGFINEILNDPSITGDELGKTICNDYASYYNQSEGPVKRDFTLATYDLNKVDKVCIETNYLTKYFYDTLKNNISKYWTLASMQKSRLRYNRNNMDIGSLLDYLETTQNFNYNTTNYRHALNEFILHKVSSDNYANRKALCLTLYYPDSILNMKELNNYRNVCFSPYWLNYIELITLRNSTENISYYNENKWSTSPYFFESNFDFLNYDIFESNDNQNVYKKLCSNSNYYRDGFVGNWQTIFSTSSSHQSGYIPPHLLRSIDITCNNNKFSATITTDNFKNIYDVNSSLFITSNDSLICLGATNNVVYSISSGEISSTFNGEWFMLPDGQLLTTYIIEKNNNYTIYSFPVMIDNIESSIRIKETKKSNSEYSYDLMGVWDTTIDGLDGRGYMPLKKGTSIIPIYDVYDIKSNTYSSEFGEEYIISSDFDFIFGQLKDGEYSFAYELSTLNGSIAYSNMKDFNITNSKLTINK